MQAAERHYCCQAGQLPGQAAARRLRNEPLCKVAHFALCSAKCCAVSGSKQQTLSVTSYVCTSQSSAALASITPTLMLKEVPCWFSSDIRNSYCAVLARTTNSAHSPPARPVPTLHCTAQSSHNTGRLIWDLIGSSLHSNMQKNEKTLRSVCLEWNEESENAKKFIVLLLWVVFSESGLVTSILLGRTRPNRVQCRSHVIYYRIRFLSIRQVRRLFPEKKTFIKISQQRVRPSH